MLPDHSAADLGFMLISTASALPFDDASKTRPHSAEPHGSIRIDPLLPSVCQSPSGVSAVAPSASCEVLGICGATSGAGCAATVGTSIGAAITGVIDSIVDG